MKASRRSWQWLAAGGFGAAVLAVLVAATHPAKAGFPWRHHHASGNGPVCVPGEVPAGPAWEGTWYWLRSPDEEKRVITGLYNRYCIRCHAVDGRGVWDVPDVPDFSSSHWQASRSDAQLARIILEGRGAVMPPFRGTLTLEEAWGMARYLRTFVPGTEIPRDKEPERVPPPREQLQLSFPQ